MLCTYKPCKSCTLNLRETCSRKMLASRPGRQPLSTGGGGPVPPADVAEDGRYGYGDAVPPGDIGSAEGAPPGRPRRTTLLDLIMGQ